MAEDRDIESEIETILGNAGLHLLEFSLSRWKGNIKVKAVIYSPNGTGTDECTKATRLIIPQVQLAFGAQDPDIEISSPGIDRVLKTERDWKAFVGKAVKILLHDKDDWISGKLAGYADGAIEFSSREGAVTIALSSIAKARLDSSRKGE